MKIDLPLFAGISLIAVTILACSQTGKTSQKKESDLPAIQVQQTNGKAVLDLHTIDPGEPVILLFFNSTCDHCQKEAADLVKHKTELKKIKVIMLSTEEIPVITDFYQTWSLSEIDHLIIGKDINNTGLQLYRFESFPYCVVFSRDLKYLRAFERNFTTEEVLQELKNKGEL